MSRSRGPWSLLAAGLLLGPVAGAQEIEAPELDFLEYLGSWPVDDEEWLLVIEWEPDSERSAPEKLPASEEDP